MDEPLTPSSYLWSTLNEFTSHLCYTNLDDEDYHPHTSTTFTKWVKYFNTIENFWTQWRQEYLLKLRESHWWYEERQPDKCDVGDVVIIHDKSPRGLWKLRIIEKALKGRDKVRGAVVRVGSGHNHHRS